MATRKNKKRSPFGQRLFDAREARGLSQKEAAESLGLAPSTLSQAEVTGIGSEKVVHMARLYRVDPWWLAEGEGSPYSPATNFSAEAANLAAAFDRLSGATPAESAVKVRLYWGFLQMMGAEAPASSQTPSLAPRPSGERLPSR